MTGCTCVHMWDYRPEPFANKSILVKRVSDTSYHQCVADRVGHVGSVDGTPDERDKPPRVVHLVEIRHLGADKWELWVNGEFTNMVDKIVLREPSMPVVVVLTCDDPNASSKRLRVRQTGGFSAAMNSVPSEFGRRCVGAVLPYPFLLPRIECRVPSFVENRGFIRTTFDTESQWVDALEGFKAAILAIASNDDQLQALENALTNKDTNCYMPIRWRANYEVEDIYVEVSEGALPEDDAPLKKVMLTGSSETVGTSPYDQEHIIAYTKDRLSDTMRGIRTELDGLFLSKSDFAQARTHLQKEVARLENASLNDRYAGYRAPDDRFVPHPMFDVAIGISNLTDASGSVNLTDTRRELANGDQQGATNSVPETSNSVGQTQSPTGPSPNSANRGQQGAASSTVAAAIVGGASPAKVWACEWLPHMPQLTIVSMNTANALDKVRKKALETSIRTAIKKSNAELAHGLRLFRLQKIDAVAPAYKWITTSCVKEWNGMQPCLDLSALLPDTMLGTSVAPASIAASSTPTDKETLRDSFGAKWHGLDLADAAARATFGELLVFESHRELRRPSPSSQLPVPVAAIRQLGNAADFVADTLGRAMPSPASGTAMAATFSLRADDPIFLADHAAAALVALRRCGSWMVLQKLLQSGAGPSRTEGWSEVAAGEARRLVAAMRRIVANLKAVSPARLPFIATQTLWLSDGPKLRVPGGAASAMERSAGHPNASIEALTAAMADSALCSRKAGDQGARGSVDVLKAHATAASQALWRTLAILHGCLAQLQTDVVPDKKSLVAKSLALFAVLHQRPGLLQGKDRKASLDALVRLVEPDTEAVRRLEEWAAILETQECAIEQRRYLPSARIWEQRVLHGMPADEGTSLYSPPGGPVFLDNGLSYSLCTGETPVWLSHFLACGRSPMVVTTIGELEELARRGTLEANPRLPIPSLLAAGSQAQCPYKANPNTMPPPFDACTFAVNLVRDTDVMLCTYALALPLYDPSATTTAQWNRDAAEELLKSVNWLLWNQDDKPSESAQAPEARFLYTRPVDGDAVRAVLWNADRIAQQIMLAATCQRDCVRLNMPMLAGSKEATATATANSSDSTIVQSMLLGAAIAKSMGVGDQPSILEIYVPGDDTDRKERIEGVLQRLHNTMVNAAELGLRVLPLQECAIALQAHAEAFGQP